VWTYQIQPFRFAFRSQANDHQIVIVKFFDLYNLAWKEKNNRRIQTELSSTTFANIDISRQDIFRGRTELFGARPNQRSYPCIVPEELSEAMHITMICAQRIGALTAVKRRSTLPRST